MIELGGAQPAPSKEELLAALKQDLTNLITTDVRGDVDPEKTYQYSQSRRYELYDRGKQYLVPQLVNNQVVDWSDVGTVKYTQGGAATGRYDHVINVLRGDKQKFVAVLGQRCPVVKCMPDRSDDEEAALQSRRADLEARKLYTKWEVERRQRELCNAVWKTTTVFGFVDYVADAAKYGTTEEPQYELQDQPQGEGSYRCMHCGAEIPEAEGAAGVCPQCAAPLGPESHVPAQTAQVPVQTGMKSYPKGSVEMAIATINEVTTPFYARSVDDLPWLIYEYEEHLGRILGLYPDNQELREKLTKGDMRGGSPSGGGAGAQAMGTMARETAASPSGSPAAAKKNRVLYSRIWLQPLMYELIKDEAKRKLLVENFKSGAKLTLVGDELVDIEDDKLIDHWKYCKPSVSDYLYADPICADFIGIQDLINDMHNIAVESYERSVPWFLFDPQVLDPVQMKKHALLPGEGVPAKAGAGGSLASSIWKAPTSEPSAQMSGWIEGLRQTGREMTGVLPAIFGAEGPSQTAREAELRRNQALMQLGCVWAEMRSFWSGCFELGVRLTAKYAAAHGGEEEGAPEEALASLAELQDGKWHCEAEEAMPMTWGQRRDFYMFLVDKGPAAWQMFGLQSPDNLPAIQQALGMDNWKVPNADARDKVFWVIGQLVKGKPQSNPMTGKIEPSVPVDVFEDDHQFCAGLVKDWCQSDKGRTFKQTNPDGYSNVVAWGMAHLDLTMPDPAMGPDGGQGGQGGPPPPGGAPPASGSVGGVKTPPPGPDQGTAPSSPHFAKGMPEPGPHAAA